MHGTYYKLEAIVLKTKDYKENDIVITIYSRQKGKLNLLLKGGKHITSKLAGHLEPINLIELNVVTTKGERDQIIGAQLKKSFLGSVEDVNKLGYVNYFLELVDMMTKPGEGDERIFNLLLKALARLQNVKIIKDLPLIRVLFIFKFLYLLGLKPRSADAQVNQLIGSLVRSGVDDIMNNKDIKLRFKKLFKLSQDNLNMHLNQPLKSEIFIKQITHA